MKIHKTSRRQFIASVIPACAITCMGSNRVFASVLRAESHLIQEPQHKFDKNFELAITHRQFLEAQFRNFIALAKALEKEMGKGKTIEFLKKVTTERQTNLGKQQASRMPDNSFSSFVDLFRSGEDNTMTMKIVEDTPSVFEFKVTECLYVDTFFRTKASEIGYAWVCWGDYALAKGFNPKI
ncbi:MAG: L-2-amino-thiazoline-4-carboxylic acid hydrolase, partial [Candidatus Aminicenantes bacterium]